MKKITSVILAVCMLLSVVALAGCSETPASLVNGAMAKMSDLTSLEAKMDAEIKMSMMGVDMSMPIDMHMIIEDAKSETPVSSVKAEMSFMGETVAMDMYIDAQGWAYMTVDGESYKVNAAAAAEELPLSTDLATDMVTQFPEEYFEGVEIVKDDDGSKSVTLVLTAEQYAELFGETLDSLTESMGAGITIKNVTLEISVKGGYVVEYDIEFDLDMSVQGTTLAASMDVDIDYINPGKDAKVTPPAGYENFPAIDEH